MWEAREAVTLDLRSADRKDRQVWSVTNKMGKSHLESWTFQEEGGSDISSAIVPQCLKGKLGTKIFSMKITKFYLEWFFTCHKKSLDDYVIACSMQEEGSVCAWPDSFPWEGRTESRILGRGEPRDTSQSRAPASFISQFLATRKHFTS